MLTLRRARALAGVGLLTLVLAGNGCALPALWDGHGRSREVLPQTLLAARIVNASPGGEVSDRPTLLLPEVMAVRFVDTEGDVHERTWWLGTSEAARVKVPLDAPARDGRTIDMVVSARRNDPDRHDRFRPPPDFHFVVKISDRVVRRIDPPRFVQARGPLDTLWRLGLTPFALAIDFAIAPPALAVGIPFILIYGPSPHGW